MESQCLRVEVGGRAIPVDDRYFAVRMAPGAELDISMRRYANAPTLAFPWRGSSH